MDAVPGTAPVEGAVMWRAESLFGHSEIPDHHSALHADTHESLPHRIQVIGDQLGHTFWGETAVLCHVCHAELQRHEYALGCCDDKDACCWRALSERCCW
jgi:hypothetical protein